MPLCRGTTLIDRANQMGNVKAPNVTAVRWEIYEKEEAWPMVTPGITLPS